MEELKRRFKQFLADNSQVQAPEGLYEPAHYIMNLGGKRIRPLLVLIAQQMFGTVDTNGLNVALAVECFHNFSLMHDDIMDEADIRRGKPAAHKKYGLNAGILSGDLLLIEAYDRLGQVAHDGKWEIFQRFNQMGRAVCEGQQYDVDFEDLKQVSADEYIQMIKGKTAELLAFSLWAGAVVGGATEQDCDLLFDYGIDIGIAFQIRDDYLDTFATADFGKKIGGDILQEKKTILYIKAMENATSEDKEILLSYMSKDWTEAEKIDRIRDIYECSNAKEQVLALEQTYYDRAMGCMRAISVSEDKKQPLRALVSGLMDRTT